MVSEPDKDVMREVVSKFDILQDVGVSTEEEPDCVVSFRTTFGDEAAYDVELTEEDGHYEVVLLSSTETPLMRDRIQGLDEGKIDSLFDHVIETIRELEGN